MSKQINWECNEHFVGGYKYGGEYQIIHWAGKDADVKELERRSEIGVKRFFPVPFAYFEKDTEVAEILSHANSFTEDMYAACNSAYAVFPHKDGNNIIQLQISKLNNADSLAESVALAAQANGQDGAWLRIIFVYCENERIKTTAEDVFLSIIA